MQKYVSLYPFQTQTKLYEARMILEGKRRMILEA